MTFATANANQETSQPHVSTFFQEAESICRDIDAQKIEQIVDGLVDLRNRQGRLFILGVGGSAANCSHAVNDFRKLCGIETYSPVDNVSELTARTNDEGWDTVFSEWLKVSRANENDAILIFSVGGGDLEKNISPNIVKALNLAQERKMKIYGIIGKETGYTNKVGDAVVVIPSPSSDRVTPHSEAFQAVVWHCMVSHPKLQTKATKW